MKELFKTFLAKLNSTKDKNKQLKQLVDFCLYLEQIEPCDIQDENNPIHSLFNKIYDDILNLDDLEEYSALGYANLFLLYAAMQEDPVKREFILECLRKVHNNYISGQKGVGGFARESPSNQELPALSPLVIARMMGRKDIEDWLNRNGLNIGFTLDNLIVVESADGKLQDIIHKAIAFYISDAFSDEEKIVNIMQMLAYEEGICKRKTEILAKNNPQAAMLLGSYIAKNLNSQGVMRYLFEIIYELNNAGHEDNAWSLINLIPEEMGRNSLEIAGILCSKNEEYSFDYSNILPQDDSVKFYADVIAVNKHIKTLRLYSLAGSLGTDMCLPFAAALLKRKTNITKLAVTLNTIYPCKTETFGEALKSNKTLTSLEFNTKGGEVKVAPIMEALGTNQTIIENIELRIVSGISKEDVRSIADMLKNNRTIISLSLSQINDTLLTILMGGMESNNTLTALNLSSTSLMGSSSESFMRVLKTNRALSTLQLTSSYIRPDYLQEFMSGLGENEIALTDLNMKESWSGIDGLSFAGDMLRTNKSVKILNLSSNYSRRFISSYNDRKAVLQEIFDGLGENTTLSSLDFSKNDNIGKVIAKDVVAGLSKNSTLTELKLCDNEIEEGGVKEILDAILLNPNRTEYIEVDIFSDEQKIMVRNKARENCARGNGGFVAMLEARAEAAVVNML